MKYEELSTRVTKAGFDFTLPGSGINFVGRIGFADDHEFPLSDPMARRLFADVAYNITQMSDGMWTIYGSDDRQTVFRLFDPQGNRVVFDSEDAVCDYVWAKLTKPRPAPAHIEITPEMIEAQRRRHDEYYEQEIAKLNKEHGIE